MIALTIVEIEPLLHQLLLQAAAASIEAAPQDLLPAENLLLQTDKNSLYFLKNGHPSAVLGSSAPDFVPQECTAYSTALGYAPPWPLRWHEESSIT
jgi:hypothetical protein